MKIVITCFLVCCVSVWTWAQSPTADSTKKDSLQLTEDLVLHQQQRKLDSLVKIRIEKELGQLSGDSKQRQDLEKQLQQIAVNDSLRSSEQRAKIDRLKVTATGFPVMLETDTLFQVYLRLGSFLPAERAAAITARIEQLYEDDFFDPDTLHLVPNETSYDIVYKSERVILSVTELDALFFDKTPEALATEYLARIKSAIRENQRANSLLSWLKRLGLVALVIVGILLVIIVINRLFLWLRHKLVSKREVYFKGITIKNFEVFDASTHLRFGLRVVAVIKLFSILLMLYLSLPLLFYIFPQTKEYTHTLLRWIISPAKAVLQSVVSFLPNLFTILVIYLFTRYAVKGVRFIAQEIQNGDLRVKGFYSDWANPTFNIIRFLLYAFMLIVIFPYLPGSSSPAFQGVSVFLGILFSLGSSSAIANIVAGLVITYMRPFKVGDRVKIGEITGDVLEKTMLVTRIRTIKNEEITVPNAMVLSSHTTNFSMGAETKGLIIHTSVTIGYDVPWPQVHRALIDAAGRTGLLEKEPAPFVLQTGLEDFYVAYQVNAYTRQPASLARIYSDLHQHIQDCFKEAGIEIMSPHYRATRDGSATTIPQDSQPAAPLSPVHDAPSTAALSQKGHVE